LDYLDLYNAISFVRLFRGRSDWLIFELTQNNICKLCIIHKLVRVLYKKTAYEDTILNSENLRINKKQSLFICKNYFS